MTYLIAAEAEKDLESIIDFTLKHWGRLQVERYLESLHDTLGLLSKNPNAGRKRPEISKGLFSFPYQSHSIFYLADTDFIVVVRVLHQSADFEQYF